MQLKHLRPNVKNPRKISEKKLAMLQKSMDKYGDLGGFLYNRRTKNLFGGHQKQKAAPANSPITITQKYDVPTRTGTVAEGHIEINGERYKYREVDWDVKLETEAMIAANKHSGEWDTDILRLNIAEIPGIDLDAIGFEVPELRVMNIAFDPIFVDLPVNKGGPEKAKGAFDQDNEKEADSPQGDREEQDAEYVKNTPQVTEQIHTENLSTSKAFDSIEEETEVKGRRIVIIIDCPNEETKKKLREELRPIVEPSGARFF